MRLSRSSSVSMGSVASFGDLDNDSDANDTNSSDDGHPEEQIK
jgi:hypothetical protein